MNFTIKQKLNGILILVGLSFITMQFLESYHVSTVQEAEHVRLEIHIPKRKRGVSQEEMALPSLHVGRRGHIEIVDLDVIDVISECDG